MPSRYDCPKCGSKKTGEIFTLTGYMEDYICYDCKWIWWPYPGPSSNPFNKKIKSDLTPEKNEVK